MNPNSQNPQQPSNEKSGPDLRASGGDHNRQQGGYGEQKQSEKKPDQDKYASPRRQDEDDADEKNAPGRQGR